MWKPTAKKKEIMRFPHTGERGYKRHLCFHEFKYNENGTKKNEPPEKTDWLMHEYTIEHPQKSVMGDTNYDPFKLEDWALCKVYLKIGGKRTRYKPPKVASGLPPDFVEGTAPFPKTNEESNMEKVEAQSVHQIVTVQLAPSSVGGENALLRETVEAQPAQQAITQVTRGFVKEENEPMTEAVEAHTVNIRDKRSNAHLSHAFHPHKNMRTLDVPTETWTNSGMQNFPAAVRETPNSFPLGITHLQDLHRETEIYETVQQRTGFTVDESMTDRATEHNLPIQHRFTDPPLSPPPQDSAMQHIADFTTDGSFAAYSSECNLVTQGRFTDPPLRPLSQDPAMQQMGAFTTNDSFPSSWSHGSLASQDVLTDQILWAQSPCPGMLQAPTLLEDSFAASAPQAMAPPFNALLSDAHLYRVPHEAHNGIDAVQQAAPGSIDHFHDILSAQNWENELCEYAKVLT